MRTIETVSRAGGVSRFRGRKEHSSRTFFHRLGAGDRADCVRARARDLPVRLGRLEAPRGDRGFLRRSVRALDSRPAITRC